MKKEWIIGIGGSECDNVYFERVNGSKEQVKAYLFQLIMEERETEERESGGSWDFGTEDVEDITESISGELYGYNCFSSYHTDYSAKLLTDVNTIDLETDTDMHCEEASASIIKFYFDDIEGSYTHHHGETYLKVYTRDFELIEKYHDIAKQRFYDGDGDMNELEYFEEALQNDGIKYEFIKVDMEYEY